MNARHLATTVLVIWLVAACAGTERPTAPPPPPANPPSPPPQPPPPPPPSAPPIGYFVAPNGSSGAAGTIADPWSYEHAFTGAGGKIHPGDTVWFRAGTYTIDQHRPITVNGTGETSRVVFRAYPGERAIFTATSAIRMDRIDVEGDWLTLWDLEITNTAPERDRDRGASIYNNGNCNRFLSLVVHDGGHGFYNEPVRYGTELIGSIFYNNGWRKTADTGRGDGHAMYIKSNPSPPNTCQPGQARIVVKDNVAFNGFGFGIHAYTDRPGESVSAVLLEGNVLFNNGSVVPVSDSHRSSNLLLAGDAEVVIVNNDSVRRNMTYYSPTTKLQNPGGGIRVGYEPGAWSPRHDHAVVTDNYSVGGSNALQIRNWDTIVVRGNVAAGPSIVHLEDSGLANYTWDANTYYGDANSPAWHFNAPPAPEASGVGWQQWKNATGLGGTDVVTAQPAAPKVFVRSLAPYLPGRGHIIIYNWSSAPSVQVDLSPVLAAGDSFAVWNVQDLFASQPVLSGRYKGGTVTLLMDGVTPPAPVGGTRMPPKTGPEFDVFVVQKR
jgi:hypothetical protein